MKPIFFLIAALLAAITSFGQKQPETKILHFQEPITSLTIESGMTVVLTDDASTDIRIVGNASDASDIFARMNDGTLSLHSANPDQTPKVTVFIPAASLRKVILNAAVKLSSASVLSTPKLHILVAGESTVNVRSIGQLTVQADHGFDFRSGKR